MSEFKVQCIVKQILNVFIFVKQIFFTSHKILK